MRNLQTRAVTDRDERTAIELRCTLMDARIGLRRDVQIVAPVGATLADLLAAGANDYIAKPLDVDRLLSLVRVWMPRSTRP